MLFPSGWIISHSHKKFMSSDFSTFLSVLVYCLLVILLVNTDLVNARSQAVGTLFIYLLPLDITLNNIGCKDKEKKKRMGEKIKWFI